MFGFADDPWYWRAATTRLRSSYRKPSHAIFCREDCGLEKSKESGNLLNNRLSIIGFLVIYSSRGAPLKRWDLLRIALAGGAADPASGEIRPYRGCCAVPDWRLRLPENNGTPQKPLQQPTGRQARYSRLHRRWASGANAATWGLPRRAQDQRRSGCPRAQNGRRAGGPDLAVAGSAAGVRDAACR